VQDYRRCICDSRQVRHDNRDTGLFVCRCSSPDDRIGPIGNAERRPGERAAYATIRLEAIESLRGPRGGRVRMQPARNQTSDPSPVSGMADK
jgi:hypothetical protein